MNDGSNRAKKRAAQRNLQPVVTRSKPKVTIKVRPAGLILVVVLVFGFVAGGVLVARRLIDQSTVIQPSSVVSSREILAQERFDNLDHWSFPPSSGKDYKISLVDGQFHGEVTGTALHEYLTGDYDSASVEADMKWVDGSTDVNARYGLIVRYTPTAAYYFEYYPFQDGKWTFQLGTKDGGKDSFTMLGSGNLARGSQRSATAYTHMRSDMTAGRARLYVNEVEVGQADLSRVAKGQVGLVITADPEKRTHVAVDDFIVRR